MKPITALALLLLIPAVGVTLDLILGPHVEAALYSVIITWLIVSRVEQ